MGTTWTSAGASKMCGTDPKVHKIINVKGFAMGGGEYLWFVVSIHILIPRP